MIGKNSRFYIICSFFSIYTLIGICIAMEAPTCPTLLTSETCSNQTVPALLHLCMKKVADTISTNNFQQWSDYKNHIQKSILENTGVDCSYLPAENAVKIMFVPFCRWLNIKVPSNKATIDSVLGIQELYDLEEYNHYRQGIDRSRYLKYINHLRTIKDEISLNEFFTFMKKRKRIHFSHFGKKNINGYYTLTFLKYFSQLESISLRAINVKLDNAIASFIHCTELDLRNIACTTIPEELGNLINLKKLSIVSNKALTTLPDSLGKLLNLEKLDLENNNLNTVPTSLEHLKELTYLRAPRNCFSIMPPCILKLPQIETLILSNNYISECPIEIIFLPYLRTLYLAHNPNIFIPEAVKEHFSSTEKTLQL